MYKIVFQLNHDKSMKFKFKKNAKRKKNELFNLIHEYFVRLYIIITIHKIILLMYGINGGIFTFLSDNIYF